MEKTIFQILWLILYWYYLGQAGRLEKGKGKLAAGIGLTFGLLLLSFWIPLWQVWLLISAVMLLFDLFFDGEPFSVQWWRILLPGVSLAAVSCFSSFRLCLLNAPVLYLFWILLTEKRGCLRAGNGILTAMVYGLTAFLLWLSGAGAQLPAAQFSPPGGQPSLYTAYGREALWENSGSLLFWGGVLLETLLFLILEGTLFFYQKSFENRSENLRDHFMKYQYQEVREIYMDMRGWRHDYHNHMQVMKAHLATGDTDRLQDYLEELEKELDRVDTLVNSGNIMADAILNSKLTLAGRRKIQTNCKAQLPEKIPVEDVDLCVILGNLLDNALESCAQIEEKERFLRIYMTVNKRQLYLSVQNSAKEETDFDARHYITKKRGNHGLGMKRVKAAVDKYHGYLNLANEPGIFAAEVTMPLEET